MNLNPPAGLLGLNAIRSDGVAFPIAADGTVTLGVATYFIPIGAQSAPTPSLSSLMSVHLAWAAALRATITIEVCNFPGTKSGDDALGASNPDVTDVDVTAGNWIPLTAAGNGVVEVVAATATGLSVGTITAAGGLYYKLQDLGARRVRLKLVVTTGGAVRALARGKVE